MKIVIKIILGIVFVAFVAFCLFMVFMVCGGAAQASVIKANDCTVESIQAACDQVEAAAGCFR